MSKARSDSNLQGPCRLAKSQMFGRFSNFVDSILVYWNSTAATSRPCSGF
jgi:hypothetical protein